MSSSSVQDTSSVSQPGSFTPSSAIPTSDSLSTSVDLASDAQSLSETSSAIDSSVMPTVSARQDLTSSATDSTTASPQSNAVTSTTSSSSSSVPPPPPQPDPEPTSTSPSSSSTDSSPTQPDTAAAGTPTSSPSNSQAQASTADPNAGNTRAAASSTSSSAQNQGTSSPTASSAFVDTSSPSASPSGSNASTNAPSSGSDQPASTLTSAIVVTSTANGSTFVTTPASITSVVVVSDNHGIGSTTFTSVFANPTIAKAAGDLSSSSFFDNKGAVAGVFVVLGVLLVGVAAGLFCCVRRRRRRASERVDFSIPPNMQQHRTGPQSILVNVPERDDPERHLMAPSLDEHGPAYGESQDSHASHAMQGGLGLTGVQARRMHPRDPFSDFHRYVSTGDTRMQGPDTRRAAAAEAIGLAFTRDYEDVQRVEVQSNAQRTSDRPPSPTPSTPSIYPPSLPPVPEKDEAEYEFYERQTQRRQPPNDPLPIPPKAITRTDAKPSNPFASPLDTWRPMGKKPSSSGGSSDQSRQSYRPLTPPDSTSGDSPVVAIFVETKAGEDPTKAPNPFANSFLGRTVSAKSSAAPIARPERNPLRVSTSNATLKRD